MGTHARIDAGWIAIDARAWLDQRTGGPILDLTAALRAAWAARARFTNPQPPDWTDLVPRWLTDHRYPSPDPADPDGLQVITHAGTRLDADLWIARATTPNHGPIAVVLINDDPPGVYADTAGDLADWYDADTVDIVCPNGHGWTWRTGRELITADRGAFTTVTVVFGTDLDAPFRPCPHCQAHRLGGRPDPCGCDGTPWIICPTCGARCDVELPDR
jgi:hypothetical protein